MYYASFKTPRVLVWVIGTVILIMMIVIGFLGYLNSPKWLNINIYIFLIYYIIIYINIYFYIYYTSIVNTQNYNKFNIKFIISLNKRFYSSTSNNGEINISYRLNLIIKELGLNPVYIFENLDSENTRQQILKSTKGLSGTMWFRESQVCLNKLSNSGDALKLRIPSGNRKVTCGWTNYSCKVTSQKILIRYTLPTPNPILKLGIFLISIMKETLIGNRGSKSDFITKFVKEQRVKGNWQEKWGSSPSAERCPFSCLRCTLGDFERNYPIRNLSNQINIQIRRFSSYKVVQQFVQTQNGAPQQYKINPWFITGFTDGKGSFTVSITRDNSLKFGWRVRLFFQINLHEKDEVLLEQIKQFFLVGRIDKTINNTINYKVYSVKDLLVIRKHFDKFPLHTKKRADFELWIKVLDLIQDEKHLTIEGLRQIAAIRASTNGGLTPVLKSAFPGVIPVERPTVLNCKIQDPL